MTSWQAGYGSGAYQDPTPVPEGHESEKVQEVGATSAPLKSASYFIGAKCGPYNEDFMLCKEEAKGNPEGCLKEGRRVTRCAIDLLTQMRSNCGEEWKSHWECLERGNQKFYMCRPEERRLNDCVFEKLKLKKEIPGSPEDQEPVHLKRKPIFKPMQK